MVDGAVELGTWLGDRLGRRHPVVGAMVASPSAAAQVVRGAAADADFELGSVSKGVTGLLYADALRRGEVLPGARLGDLLPLTGSAVADVRLRDLATHRSGLPPLPRAEYPTLPTLRKVLAGANPYGETLEELLGQARRAEVGRRRVRYSNFGFELLGHAVAAATGRSYRVLLEERLVEPLGLVGLYAPAGSGELRPGALLGRTWTGRLSAPWTGEAVAPAGGLRAGPDDLVRLAQALLVGAAPGLAALDPAERLLGKTWIGAGWVVSRIGGRTVTWHDGGTGGFRSWFGLDREAGVAAAVLNARAAGVGRIGAALLQAAREDRIRLVRSAPPA